MNEDTAPNEPGSTFGRRGLISGLALGGVAVGGGAVGAIASRASGSSTYRRRELVLEVACLGELYREGASVQAQDDADFRRPFLVEGWIYPEGTIKGDGFIPVEAGSIGRWFCRGYGIIDAARAEPHTSSYQDFLLGSITHDDLFPRNMISVVGLEGTSSRTQLSTRAVIGGTGEYLGATGQVTERYFADNSSQWFLGGGSSPCFRFEFDLRVLD